MPEYDSPDIQPLLEAMDQAYEAQTRFDVARQLEAEGHDADVRAERIRCQQFVVGLFKRLRPYLATSLEEYYHEKKIYDGPKGEFYGLKNLTHYQGAINESSGIDEDGEVFEEREAGLMPPSAMRNALDLLSECVYLLGFMPDSREREETFYLGDEDENEQATTNATGD
jgi:hypothetical protein